MTDTMVINITPDKTVFAMNAEKGYMAIRAGAIVLAMAAGTYPRRHCDPGDRPSGIFTAGTAQRTSTLRATWSQKGADPRLGRHRPHHGGRMTLEGAEVKAVVELMPYSNASAEYRAMSGRLQHSALSPATPSPTSRAKTTASPRSSSPRSTASSRSPARRWSLTSTPCCSRSA